MASGCQTAGLARDEFEGSNAEAEIFREIFFAGKYRSAGNKQNTTRINDDYCPQKCYGHLNSENAISEVVCKGVERAKYVDVLTTNHVEISTAEPNKDTFYSEFEGSNAEAEIFREVFFGGTDHSASSKHSMMRINGDYCPGKCFGHLSTENAVSEVLCKGVEQSKELNVVRMDHLEISSAEPDKNTFYSCNRLIPELPTEVVSSPDADATAVCQPVLCNIAEFSDGVIASRQYTFQAESPTHMHRDSDGNRFTKSILTGQQRKFTEKSKSSTSSLQECPGLVSVPVTYDVRYHTLLACMKQQTIENEPSNLETVSVRRTRRPSLISKLIRDLRSHAQHLLLDAGWKMKMYHRRTENTSYIIYSLPGVPTVCSLVRAWVVCGEMLAANCFDSKDEGNARVWNDTNAFWSDLTDILAYLVKESPQDKNSLSIFQRWLLLDPFMAVACIHKKIRTLQEGVALKAVNSSVTILEGSDRETVQRMIPDKIKDYLAKLNSRLLSHPKCSLLPLFIPGDVSGTKQSFWGGNLSTSQEYPGSTEEGELCCKKRLCQQTDKLCMRARLQNSNKPRACPDDTSLHGNLSKLPNNDCRICSSQKGEGSRGALGSQKTYKIKVSAVQEKKKTDAAKAKKNTMPGDCCNTSMVNQTREIPQAGQQVMLQCPQGEAMIFKAGESYRVLVSFTEPCSTQRSNLQSCPELPVYQASLVGRAFGLSTSNPFADKVGFPVYCTLPTPVQHENVSAKKVVRSKCKLEASKRAVKRARTVSLAAKARKRLNVSNS